MKIGQWKSLLMNDGCNSLKIMLLVLYIYIGRIRSWMAPATVNRRASCGFWLKKLIPLGSGIFWEGGNGERVCCVSLSFPRHRIANDSKNLFNLCTPAGLSHSPYCLLFLSVSVRRAFGLCALSPWEYHHRILTNSILPGRKSEYTQFTLRLTVLMENNVPTRRLRISLETWNNNSQQEARRTNKTY